MKLSHIILKVDNLDKAVKEYREKGFMVEYGKTKNPYNALIYFSKGPYIELIASTGMPSIIKFLMKLFGKKYLVDRINNIDNAKAGYCDLAIENYGDNFEKEKTILKKYGINSCEMFSRRFDTHNRDLRFKIAFPSVYDIPFMMTYFSIDPKPVDFVHPNGIKRVKKVIYKTDAKYFSVIRELCDDEHLELLPGKGIEVEF